MDFISIVIGLNIGAISTYIFCKKYMPSKTKYTLIKEKNTILANELESAKSIVEERNIQLISESNKNSQLSANLLNSEKKIEEYTIHTDELRYDLKENNETIIKLNQQLAEQNANLKYAKEKQENFKTELAEMQNVMRLQFEKYSNQLLDEKSEKFTKQNEINISKILTPLNEKIKDFEKKINDTYLNENKDRNLLKVEIENLVKLNKQISEEANNLTKALKGENKTQGNWGEFILEKILEQSGLVKDREFVIQESVVNSEGKRYQPDIVVKYPGDKNIIIDSKVSIVAYESYCNCDNKIEKEKFLSQHISSIKKHITDLSDKKYEDLYGIKGLDFVFMFMPIEPAYLIAIQTNPELWNFAYNKKVLLISPTNLIAALKLIYNLWQQENQSKNVLAIAKQAGSLYDKFVGLTSDITTIGKKIDETKDFYDKAINKLSTGNGNLVGQVEKLKILGAKTKKQISEDLLN